MTATDTIRAMLDERGVEYRQIEWVDGDTVKWRGSDGCEYGARNMLSFDGLTSRLVLYDLTPEQAIEATLGRGECEKLPSDGITRCFVRRYGYEREFGYWKCSACGCECFEGARYCMGCGRKAVDA